MQPSRGHKVCIFLFLFCSWPWAGQSALLCVSHQDLLSHSKRPNTHGLNPLRPGAQHSFSLHCRLSEISVIVPEPTSPSPCIPSTRQLLISFLHCRFFLPSSFYRNGITQCAGIRVWLSFLSMVLSEIYSCCVCFSSSSSRQL